MLQDKGIVRPYVLLLYRQSVAWVLLQKRCDISDHWLKKKQTVCAGS